LVVLAIHDLEMAARFCTTLVLLANGKILVQGEPSKVLTEQRVVEVFGVPVRRFRDPYGDFIRFSFLQGELKSQASAVIRRLEEWV
jgi:iron complex transport system ATP-binding protein